jgi:hypothetical protein
MTVADLQIAADGVLEFAGEHGRVGGAGKISPHDRAQPDYGLWQSTGCITICPAAAQQITEGRSRAESPFLLRCLKMSATRRLRDYAMECHKALSRALMRAPRLEADELRQVDTDRCEEMYLRLSSGIRLGDHLMSCL